MNRICRSILAGSLAVAMSATSANAALRSITIGTNPAGTLFNSATETWTANGGFAFFRDDSHLGVSVGVYDTFYGVPIRPGAGHHGEGEEGGEEELDV